MRLPTIIFLTLYLIGYLVTLTIGLVFYPAPLANAFGFISLLGYVATLLPSLLRIIFPALKRNKALIWLLKYRRHLGVFAFGFGLTHGVLLGVERQLNFLDWQIYIHYCQGIAMLSIFTLLAVTSNNESIKTLKQGWKKLHYSTYLVIFLMPWHIVDKMWGHWSQLTPYAIVISMMTVLLFLYRKWLERVERLKESQQKQPGLGPASVYR
jgi:sulfoxide reductase heme-binding subunit YedZ